MLRLLMLHLFLIIGALGIWPFVCYSNQDRYFRHYSVENGLSNNCVTSLLQDRTGFLWVGTRDGLNRFDGYTFKVFRKGGIHSGSIGNNYIHTLFEDSTGVMWVGTERGLFQYHEKKEVFRLIPATSNLYIDRIAEDKDGDLWIISCFSLYRYKRRTKRLEFFDHRSLFSATNVCTTRDGALWVSTTSGTLLKYNFHSGRFEAIDLFGHSKPAINKWIEHLYASSDGLIVVSTANTEIKLFDPSDLSYTDVTVSSGKQRNLYIRTIVQATASELWLGTEFGIFIYDRKSGITRHVEKEHGNPYALTDNAVYALKRDKEGGIWVGTYWGGVHYLPRPYTLFSKYYPQNGVNAISGNVVREVKKDEAGNLWIGTEDAGLNKLDLKTGRFTSYLPGESGLSFVNIHGVLPVKGEIWVGTFLHGLDIIDAKTGKRVRNYTVEGGAGFTHDFIYGIYQLRKGLIVITTPHGAFAFNPVNKKFEWFKGLPKYTWYTSIIEDAEGTIWAASFGNGIYYYHPSSGRSGNFRHSEKEAGSLSNDRVNSVFEDSRKQLWFATDEGLCKLDKANSKFTCLGVKDGFPSNFIFSILEDNKGCLWISTTKGLVCFNSFDSTVSVFTKVNGLLSDQFNYNSAFKDSDGRMYFGSAKGLISFQPEAFFKPHQIAPVLLTEFSVYEKELTGKSPLDASITHTDAITLSHDQSSFSIGFASLSFSASDMIDYSYQMKGLAENWININTNQHVDFIGLSPGIYYFNVKASRSDNVGSKITSLKIEILPPKWLSPYAYGAYLLTLLSIIFIAAIKTDSRIKEKNNKRIELLKIAGEKELLKMELAKEKELLEKKIVFFTNVAHEIKTPLTLIKVPLAKVMKKVANLPGIEHHLNIVSRNTDRLLELSNQLLDFRQTEAERFKLSFKKVNISRLVEEACLGFAGLAEERGLIFIQALPEKVLEAWADEDAVNKIIYNLFNNAIKYAETTVAVRLLSDHENAATFTIQTENDGPVIPPDFRDKVFEPFFRMEGTEREEGAGIGLALSLSLAHLHGGHLILEPTTGERNVFSLVLPKKIDLS